MTVSCSCNTDTSIVKNATDCNDCSNQCADAGGVFSCVDTNTTNKVFLGLSLTVFFVMLAISIALFIFMIWFSVHVMKKCKGKPTWLNPTIISLLVIWVVLGWIPGLGLIDFVALLIILIIYNNKCKK